jgi:autotransporter-associated beta strand protein
MGGGATFLERLTLSANSRAAINCARNFPFPYMFMLHPIIRIGCVFLVLVCAYGASLRAANVNKADNTTNLNLAGSWSALPGLGDVANWTSAVTGANSSALGADLSWRGITIVGPGGPVTITGSNTLTLANNGINMSAATQDLTISSNLALFKGVGQIWDIAAGRTLTLNTGTFTRNAGASLSIQGAGTVATTNISNDATGIIGTWATIGTGAAAQYATVDGGVITGLAGTAAATAADVTDTTGLLNYSVAGVGALGPGASFNTLRYTGGSAMAITGSFEANGILNAASGGVVLSMSGAVTIGSNRELMVTTVDANRSITLSGGISNHVTGTSGVTKAGNGTLNLTAASTYTGITTISRGTISINHASALGSTLGGVMIHSGDNGSTPTTVGGALSVSGGLTLKEAIAVTNPNASGNPVTSLTSTGTNIFDGTFFISGNAVRFNSSTGITTIRGGIVGSNSTMVFNGTGFNITSTPLDLGTGTFHSDSGGALTTIAVTGGLWGDTLFAGGTVKLEVANALPNTTNLRLGVSYSPTTTVDLLGINQKVANLRSDNFLVTTTGRSITSATAATLTINDTSTQTSDVRLTGAAGLTKNGAAIFNYVGSGTNTTGAITINKGTFAHGYHYASVAAQEGGTVALSNHISADTPLVLGGGTYQLSGRANGTTTGVLSGALWSSGSNTITVGNTAGLAPGQSISSGTPGLPAGAFIVAITNSTTILINANTTGTARSEDGATVIAGPASNFTTSQTFNHVTLNAGGSTIGVTTLGDGTVLNLGTMARNAGGTVMFALPTGPQNSTNGITLSNNNGNGGILGGWATMANDWAINSTNAAGGNVAAFSGYVDVTRLSSGVKTIASDVAANVRIVEGTGGAANLAPSAAGATDINTLLQSATGAATYDPGTTDVLRLGAEGGILLASNAGALTVGTAANDGVLTAGGADDTAGTLYLTNHHTSNLMTINSTIANNGTGEVTLVKSGAGTTVLAGNNTFSGKTYVGAGKLSIAAESALGVVAGGGAADQLTLAGGTLLTTATMTIDDANRGITLAPAGGTFEVSTGVLTVANVIAGPGDLTKTGSGTLALNAANTFTGETVLSAGGLALGHVNALQHSTLVANNTALTFTAAGTNTYNLGGLRGAGNISLGANSISIGANNTANQYTGVISGTGGVTKVGTGVQNFTNANSYSGTTLLSEGYLGIYHANALQNSTLDTGASSDSKAVIFGPTSSTYNIGALQGADDLDMGLNSISVGAKNTSTTFSGAIISAFNGNVTKFGAGTWTLTGTNTYGGSTTVSGGVLQVGQAGVGQSGFGSVSVTNNAQLIGTGIVRGSALTLGTGATLRGGDTVADSSHGTLTFTPEGSATFAFLTGSNTVLSIGSATNQGSIDGSFGGNTIGSAGYFAYVDAVSGAGNHDRLVFNGAAGSVLDFGGNFTVVADNFVAQAGQIFNLLDWSNSVDALFASVFTSGGLRDGLADNGSQFDLPDLNSAVTGLYWDTSRFATSGVLVVVPEPGRMLLWMLGVAVLSLRRRRKQAIDMNPLQGCGLRTQEGR